MNRTSVHPAVRTAPAGWCCFVKRFPLTDRERRPENVRSTANLFGLPPFCHYGVGGPGFGAWRQLAANVITTGWVLDGRCPGFPILHHWRVLPGAPAAPDEHADVDAAVAYWAGAPQVRERIGAVANASAGVLLFLTLDGDERALLHAHSTHDGGNVLALLVYSLVAALTDVSDWRERFALIRRWAEGDAPVGIPAAAVAVVERYAPIAVVMNDFHPRLLDDSRATPYPAAEVEPAYRAATTR